jgi:hypothetical protein
MLGVWFPVMKGLLAILAIFLGVSVMTHTILDCGELRSSCENYRRSNREECDPDREGPAKANAFDADCECKHSVVNCYTTEITEGNTVCISCDKVSADFVDFLWTTGSLVVVLGLLLMFASVVEIVIVAKELLNQQTLAILACADLGLVGGLISTVMKKRRIADSLSDVCKGEGSDDALDSAPTTMDNLCHYHWLLTWIVSLFVLLIVISTLNLCWTLFGAVVGIPPPEFEVMDEGDDAGGADETEPPRTFGSNDDFDLPQRELELRPGAAQRDLELRPMEFSRAL